MNGKDHQKYFYHLSILSAHWQLKHTSSSEFEFIYLFFAVKKQNNSKNKKHEKESQTDTI